MGRRPFWKKIVDPVNVTGYVSDLVDGKGRTQLYTGAGDIKDAFTGEAAADAAKTAAEIEAEWRRKALDQTDRIWDEQKAMQQPWLDAGKSGLRGIQSGIASGAFEPGPMQFDPSRYKMPGPYEQGEDFGFSFEDYEKSPYAKFLQGEAQRGIERSAAARGGLGSGATMGRIGQRMMDISGADYGDQYNRKFKTHQQNEDDRYTAYTTNYNRAFGERQFGYGLALDDYNRDVAIKGGRYNRLAGLSGMGQQTATYLGGQAGSYAANAGNQMTGIGQAQAGGVMGAANARARGAENIVDLGSQTLSMVNPFDLFSFLKKDGKGTGYAPKQTTGTWGSAYA